MRINSLALSCLCMIEAFISHAVLKDASHAPSDIARRGVSIPEIAVTIRP